MQGAGAVELVPWPHANQAHEWAQSIQADFDLPLKVVWTRLTDYARIQPTTEVCPPHACFVFCMQPSVRLCCIACRVCALTSKDMRSTERDLS